MNNMVKRMVSAMAVLGVILVGSGAAWANPQVQLGVPAQLKGILKSGYFMNCCMGGKEKRTRYYYISLENKTDIISNYKEDWPDMPNVENIQVGILQKELHGIKDGQSVIVSCRELAPGETGHYALPIYCWDPQITPAP